MRHFPLWLTSACVALACCAVVAGCRVPITVAANVRAAAGLLPVSDDGPVEPMTPPGCPVPPERTKIAVVDVDGLLLNADFTGLGALGDNPVSLFRERLDAIEADPGVAAVVVRINSPGGGVTATDIMWHDLQNFKRCTGLPVVACLLDLGAGGAYYLATAADRIVAHPTTVTGGIGVIFNHYNLQDAMAQFNVVGTPVKGGKNIDLGTPVAALGEEQRKLLQAMVDEFHQRFKDVVAQGRPEVDLELKTNFDGRVFTAQQARERALIDEVGYLDNALNLARRMAGEPCPEVVFYHRVNDPARSVYSITPNVPLQNSLIPLSVPGFDRARLPSFLYMWEPEPTMEKLLGR